MSAQLPSLLKKLVSRFQCLLSKGKLERDLDEELQFHLQNEIEKSIRAGMTLEEARYAALRSFGGVEQVKEQCREVRGMKVIETLWQDIRYAARTLLTSPGFTAVVVLSLALGIGVNSTMFSVINGVLLRPLNFEAPDRLVVLYEVNQEQKRWLRDPTLSSFLEWHRNTSSFEQMELAVTDTETYTVSGSGEPERIRGQFVSPELFNC